MVPTLSLPFSRFKAIRHHNARTTPVRSISSRASNQDGGQAVMIEEFKSMREQMNQLLSVIAMQQQQNIGLVNRMEELSRQVASSSSGPALAPAPTPSHSIVQEQPVIDQPPLSIKEAHVAPEKANYEFADVALDEIKRRSDELATILRAKGIEPPASLVSLTSLETKTKANPAPAPSPPPAPSMTEATPALSLSLTTTSEEMVLRAIPSPVVNRPTRSRNQPSASPVISESPQTASNIEAGSEKKWRPKAFSSKPQDQPPSSSDQHPTPQMDKIQPPAPSVNPVLRRIETSRRWQDLRSLIDRQPRGLDAAAVALAFSRLPSLLKESVEVDEELAEFAAQLLSLLQLQLQSLPNSSLSSLLGACQNIPGLVPPQRASWINGALRAVGSRMKRMSVSEISSCLIGLNALGAEPNDEWVRDLLTEVQSRLKGQALLLEDLGLVLGAISNLRSEVKPDLDWMKDFDGTLSSCSLSPSFQPSSLKGVVALIIGSHFLKSTISPMTVSALNSILNLDGTTSSPKPAIRLLQSSLKAQELVDLMSGLRGSGHQLDQELVGAIAEAAWPKLTQLSGDAPLTFFNALVEAKYSFPPAMVTSFCNQLASDTSLDLMNSQDIVALLATISSIATDKLNPASIEAVQDTLLSKGLGLAKSTSRLDPETLTSLLTSLAALEATLKPSLLPAIFRDIRPQMKLFHPLTFSRMAEALGRLESDADTTFVEAVIEECMEGGLDDAGSMPTCVLLLNALASMNVKPRASLLGPLLSSTMDVAPSLSSAHLIALLGSMATLKLKKEETQGFLKGSTLGNNSGPPSPQTFVTSLLLALNIDHLSLDDIPQISVHLKSLCSPDPSPDSASIRHSPPPPEWTQAFLTSYQAKLSDASLNSVVLVLSSLPSLTSKTSPSVPDGFVRGCLGHIEASMERMELNELCEIVEAATLSSSDSDSKFISSVAQAAGSRMSSKVQDIAILSRFAVALARSNVAPSQSLLSLFVRSSASHVKAARDGVASSSGSHRALALLLWGVSQLASNTAHTIRSSSSAGDIVDKEWVQDMIIYINRTITSSRAPFTLDDLARVIVAFAALDAQPKRETVNSFIGKSIDRLSSLEGDTCVDVLPALSSLGSTMTEKWLNQWAIRAMPALQSLESRPQSLRKVIEALRLHHTASASLPSPYLMKSLLNLISTHLQADESSRADRSSDTTSIDYAVPSTQEDCLSSRQVVSTISSLSHLGASDVLQEPKEAADFCRLAYSSLELSEINPQLILETLSTISVIINTRERPDEKDLALSAWLIKATEALSLSTVPLGASSAASFLSSISVLSSFVERDVISQASGLIKSCSEQLVTNGEKEGVSMLAKDLPIADAVDAMWGLARLSSLQFCQPPATFVLALTSALNGKVATLDALRLTRLISGLSSSSLDYQPSSSLALELSRASVSRFSSSTVPAADLADLVWSFARLKCTLPPSFAASAQRRLQAAMKDLSPSSLSKMMWSLAASNYYPSEPQLRAYASRITSALDGMDLDDLALSMEAFALFKHRLDQTSVARVVELSLPLLSDERKDVKIGAMLSNLLHNILWHANDASLLTTQWIRSCVTALVPEALLTLTPNEACSLISSLAQVGGSCFDVRDFDILLLLSRLPPIIDLDATTCKDLLHVSSIWRESLVPRSPPAPVSVTLIKELPSKIQSKLAAYGGADSAAILTSLASLYSSSQLMPLFEGIRQSVNPLIRDLSANSSGSVQSLSTRDVTRLVTAISGCRATLLSLASSPDSDLRVPVVTDLLAKACLRIKDDLGSLDDLDLILLMEALSKEAEEASGLKSRLSKNGLKAKRPEATEDEKKKEKELLGLVRAITVRLGEVMGSEARLSSVQPQRLARFINSYCKQLKFGSHHLFLSKEEEEEERKREKGEVTTANKLSSGPSEPQEVLSAILTSSRVRMEKGSLSGWESASWISFAIASSGAVPSSAWIAAMVTSASTEASPLPDAPSATRLLYAFTAWQLDPGREFASRLIEGALIRSFEVDPSLVLLGCSHCSAHGHPMDPDSFSSFVTQRLTPSLSTMSPEQIATVATSLTSLRGNGSISDQIISALESALESTTWDKFSSQLIAQIALNLIAASRNRRGQMGGSWISRAIEAVRTRSDGHSAIAQKHLSDLLALK